MDHNEILRELTRRLEEETDEPTIKTEVADYTKVSIRDLRAACTANPTHPLARVFARSVEDHDTEERTVAVSRIDLLALLQNRRSISEPLKGGKYRKTLGEAYPTGKPVDTKLPSLREESKPDEEPELGSTSPADED